MMFLGAEANAQKKKVALSLYKNLGYKVSIPKFQEADGVSQEDMTKIANSYRLFSKFSTRCNKVGCE